MKLRMNHVFGNKFITVPKDIDGDELSEWCPALSVYPDDIRPRIEAGESIPIWVGHFFECDQIFNLSKSGDTVECSGLRSKTRWMGRGRNVGSAAEDSAPRPNASRQNIEDGFFMGLVEEKYKYSYYTEHIEPHLEQVATANKKARTNTVDIASPEPSIFDTPRQQPGRKRNENGLYHSFVGCSYELLGGFKAIQEHCRNCTGTLCFKTSKVTAVGVALHVSATCSLGRDKCTYKVHFGRSKFIVKSSFISILHTIIKKLKIVILTTSP